MELSSNLAANPVVCRTHPATTVNRFCASCLGAYCNVCLFDTTGGSFCPDCMTKPAAGQQSSALTRGIVSVLGALIGTVIIGAQVLSPVLTGSPMNEGLAGFLGLVALGAMIGGLTFGLISRERGRGARSVLGIIGIGANGLLLLLYAALIVIGLSMGKS